MYNIIESFINHTWITQNAPGSQTYIYVFALIIMVVVVVTIIDLVRSVFDKFIR